MFYKYKGDKLTDPKFKGAICTFPKKANGKCFRGKNGNMIADFNGELVNIVGRLLRKII